VFSALDWFLTFLDPKLWLKNLNFDKKQVSQKVTLTTLAEGHNFSQLIELQS